MRMIGIILIIFGIAGLLWGGFTYVKDQNTVELWVVGMVTEDKEPVSIPPIVGLVSLVMGGVLVGMSSRKNSALT